MKRFLLAAALLTLPLTALFSATSVDAQDRFAERRKASQQRGEDSPEQVDAYPNTNRQEPEAKRSERNMRKIQAAYDQLNEGEYQKAQATLSDVDGNSRLSGYEQALVDQGVAQALYEQDDIDGAIARWEKAVEGNALPNNDHFQLMYQVAQLQLNEERYEESLRWLDRWFRESASTRPDAYAMKGNALYRMERYDEAIAALDQAIAAAGDKPDPTLYELKMASLYEKEDYAGASQVLEELVRRQPGEVKYKINLAQVYIELEQNDKALGILEQVRSGNQLNDAAQWRQLYQLLAYADKPADAAAVINEGIQAGKLQADKDTLRALGDQYYQAELLDQAIEAYGRAAAASPDDGNADQQRGHLLLQNERFAEAKTALDAALRKGQLRDEGTAYLLLGEAEVELGNTSAASAAFRKALGYDNSRSNAELWLKNLGAR